MRILSSFTRAPRFALQFTIVSFALALVVSLAACGGASSGTSTSSGSVTLTYWSWIAGMDKQITLFEQTHPNIHVKWENVGVTTAEYDKLYTAIKAGNGPDVAEVEYQVLPNFESTGGLLDLAPYGAASVKDKFPAWSWKLVTLGSSVYAIPQDTGPMVMYYREDILQKYNLPVPTTWAQFAEEAAKLHAANPADYMTNFPPREAEFFAGLAWQAGAHWFTINGQSWKVSINDAPTQQVASFWQSLLDKKLVKTDPELTNSWYNDIRTGVATFFYGAYANGLFQSVSPQASGKWRVALMPQWQAGQAANGDFGGGSTVALKSTKYPQQAAEFAEWISSNEQSAEIEGSNGPYPALQTAVASASFNKPWPFYGNQVLNDVEKQAASQVNQDWVWGPTMSQVNSDMGDDFVNVVIGQGTLTDALNMLQQSTITFMKQQGISVST